MNFFRGTNDLAQGMMRMMNNNNWTAGNQKESKLRKNLESCTYPDETKYMIEKAVKQVFHVYPFFDAQILMFTENGFPKRYIELKGILEVEIKGKTCKVDYNMMLPADYPRSAPFVRIINRNPDYLVDPFYQKLQSKSDKTSFILNEKLNSVRNWHQSNSLVNVIIQCYDLLKNKFPFAKPIAENNAYGGNASSPWSQMYNKGGNNNNFGGGGFNQQGANQNWGNNQQVGWGNNNGGGWPQNGNNAWGGGANWNNKAGWNGSNPPPNTGGMGGIMGGGGGNPTAVIASGQKLVGKQKQTIAQFNNYYSNLIVKNQQLDILKQSLEAEEQWLRRQNYQMTNFLNENEKSGTPDLTNVVKPSNERSAQILDLLSSVKAREDCLLLLETRFNQEEIKLEDFMKQMRRIEEARFEEKVLLNKCLKAQE